MQNDIADIKPELDVIIKIIVDTVPVEEIYLFGSYIYGTPNKDSDLDLYVVLKDDVPMRDGEAIDAMRVAIYKQQIHPVDILALKRNRFLYRSTGFATIENEVLHKGLKLYG